MFDASRNFRLRILPHRPAILCALLSVLFICPHSSAGTAEPKLRKALAERAGFGTPQIAALERGEPVAKLIPSNDPRDLAVCGVIELASDPETAIKAFQLSFSLKHKSILQSGNFTNRPRVEDLASLTLSDGDINDLKTCTLGDCKLKLSAAMIQRFQKSIDWNAIGYKEQVNQLFRLMMVEYVSAYLQRGDAALIEYDDQSTRVRLARDQESLLTNLLYVNDTAPEFVRHLKVFPRSTLPVEHSLTWTKINFGLKPVFVITDVSTYRTNVDSVPRVLVLSKQIYANRYLDASLSLTAAIADQTRTKSDLLYINHLRASELASSFSKFKHRIVESRATEDLNRVLRETMLNIEVVLSNSSLSFQPIVTPPRSEWSARRIFVWLVLLKGIGIAFYLAFGRRRRRLRKAAFSRHSDKQTERVTQCRSL